MNAEESNLSQAESNDQISKADSKNISGILAKLFFIASVLFIILVLITLKSRFDYFNSDASIQYHLIILMAYIVPSDSRRTPFYQTLRELYDNGTFSNGFRNAPESKRTDFLRFLTEYAIKEPLYPINHSCTQKMTMKYKCSDFPSTFSGPRKSPARVAHLIQFGFDTDVLEIHLNELYSVVDKFFIAESTRSHKFSTPKLLTWPIVSKQSRFKKFLDKVVYFNLTDEEMNKAGGGHDGIWRNEYAQERLRWEKFLKWNSDNNDYFTADDVVGFGDTDEIAYYQNVLLLKNCQQNGKVDIGTWFTFGKINMRFRSDFPVRGNPFTYGDPTYYLLKDAMKEIPYPSRNRGRSPFFLLGGLHMTLYQYLPSVVIKTMTETESADSFELPYLFQMVAQNKTLFELEKGFSKYMQDKWASQRYVPLPQNKLGEPPYMLPWFLKCNLNRYSSFIHDQLPDRRLET